MKPPTHYKDPDGLVHATDGYYGTSSIMNCEGNDTVRWHVAELKATTEPVTCLLCSTKKETDA